MCGGGAHWITDIHGKVLPPPGHASFRRLPPHDLGSQLVCDGLLLPHAHRGECLLLGVILLSNLLLCL